MVSALLSFAIPLSREVSCVLAPGYLLALRAGGIAHSLGIRLTPISSGDLDGVAIELLPFGVFLDPARRETVFSLEILSIAVRLFGGK